MIAHDARKFASVLCKIEAHEDPPQRLDNTSPRLRSTRRAPVNWARVPTITPAPRSQTCRVMLMMRSRERG
jgi:hypothetical protein